MPQFKQKDGFTKLKDIRCNQMYGKPEKWPLQPLCFKRRWNIGGR